VVRKAPAGADLEVEQDRHKARWIVNKLEPRARASGTGGRAHQWKDGAVVPYLGEQVTWCWTRATISMRQVACCMQTTAPCRACRARPCIGLAHGQPAQIRDAVRAWLMRQAKALFIERLNHYAPS
jgi:hypothetical protein